MKFFEIILLVVVKILLESEINVVYIVAILSIKKCLKEKIEIENIGLVIV